MSTLLGLDLGTSTFKVSAYRHTGEYLETVSAVTPWWAAASGSELRPADFANAVRTIVEECASRAGDQVAAIGVTGMAEAMFVETTDGVVHPAGAWNEKDRRIRPLPAPELFARTGLLDVARTPAVELRRITDAGGQVRSWSGLPEFAVQLLGGTAVAERSLGARSGLVDVRAGDWSAELLRWAGVEDVTVPPLLPAGTSAGVVESGPCVGAVLTVAGHDHIVAAVGSGAADDMTVFDSLGTGEALIARIVSERAALDPGALSEFAAAGFNVSLGVDVDDVIAFAGLGTGNRFNLLLKALADNGYARDKVLQPGTRPGGAPESVGALLSDEAADLVEALGGPHWQLLRGTASAIVARNVTDLESARVMWWAVVARATRNARDALDSLGRLVPQATRRVAAGGWLGSAGIREVRENMLGPFELPRVEQSGTRGAALFAGLAAGIYRSRTDFPSFTGTGATA